jgi:hypothetical protein
MELQKVLLYYRFTPIADPQAMMLWQKTLCESLGIKLNYLDIRAEVPGKNSRSIIVPENWSVKKQNPQAGANHHKSRKITVYVDR